VKRDEFENLVQREQKELRRFLLALCSGNRFEADDIAQETLVKAYMSSDGYQEQGRFVAWLYQIAHHTFLDHRRRARPSKDLDDAVPFTDETYNADNSFRYQELYLALEGLPPKERSSILLFYLKGYSIKEISQIIECNEDAVRKQLQRGRDQLRKKIRP
jgi:RNA polymerase sigma-70 factor (ECF subfamily)